MIVIGTLRERFALWPFIDCLDHLCLNLAQHRLRFAKMGVRVTNIYKGRRWIADHFLEIEEATHLLFLDSDETFSPETAWHLYNLDLPMVSGLVFQRQAPHPPCIYKRIGPDSEFNLAMAVEVKEWFDKHNVPRQDKATILNMPAEKGIWEIDECGTGCLLIKREVLEAIPLPRFTGMGDVGTDISFCRRARKAGFPIYVDLRVQLGHITEYPITQANFRVVDEWVTVVDEGMKDE